MAALVLLTGTQTHQVSLTALVVVIVHISLQLVGHLLYTLEAECILGLVRFYIVLSMYNEVVLHALVTAKDFYYMMVVQHYTWVETQTDGIFGAERTHPQ